MNATALNAALLGFALSVPVPSWTCADDPTTTTQPSATAPRVIEQDVAAERTSTVVIEVSPKPPPPWEYPERGLAFYPAGPGAGKDRWAVGGIWQVAPMFTAGYWRGLGAGFTLDAGVQTIVLYNQLGVGAGWAAKAGPFSLGLMAHVAGWFGALGKALVDTTSFDALGWGINLNPGAKAGLQITRNTWLTLQFETYLSLYQATKLGTLVLSPNAPSYQGFGGSLIVEYAPRMQGVIYYGASVYNTAANYPIWFNAEATSASSSFSPMMIWYFGVLAGYEF